MNKTNIFIGKLFTMIGVLLLTAPLNVTGQIRSASANYTDVTSYVAHPKQDTVFVFNKSKDQTEDAIGALQLRSPDGEKDWIFQWYAYDSASREFDFSTALKTDNNDSISELTNIASGGYAVVYFNGTMMDTAVAWVFVNDFINQPVTITHKNDEGQLLPSRYTCDYVELKADLATDTFHYYDLSNDSMLLLSNYVNYSWTSDPEGKKPDESENVYKLNNIRSRTYDPPTEDTHYFLEVTDKFGVTQRDTVFYETIQTKAILDTLAPPVTFNDGGQYYNNTNEDLKSAPYKMFFNPGESENAARYVWNFDNEEGDTTYFTADSVEHIFYDPLKSPYVIKLTTYSEENCLSSDSVEIEIAESELHVPPYFTPKKDQPGFESPEFITPNGDGNNDYFRVFDVSIREFEIVIFNRWGRVVNKSEGPDIRDWMGWDGYIGDSKRPAPEGVYYFVLRAKGWDGVKYKYPNSDQEIKGFFHLFREGN
jgi:gliding motility-associated-like protein